jgi:hypothetical protein
MRHGSWSSLLLLLVTVAEERKRGKNECVIGKMVSIFPSRFGNHAMWLDFLKDSGLTMIGTD